MLRLFQEGGAGMIVVLGVDLFLATGAVLAFVLALLSIRAARARGLAKLFGAALLVGSVTPSLVGYGAYATSMRRVDLAVEYADPEFREALRTAGEEESRIPLNFGFGSSAVALLGSLVVLAVAFAGEKLGGGAPAPEADPSPGE